MIDQGSGHIAVTSSAAGKFGVPLRTGYCAAKHAVMGFFNALGGEVVYPGIKVSTIVPGLVKTNVAANALKGDGSPLGPEEGHMAQGMEVADFAEAVVAQLADEIDEIEIVTGGEKDMLALKRADPIALFRAMDGMAEQLYR